MESNRSENSSYKDNLDLSAGSESEKEKLRFLSPEAIKALRSMLQERLQQCGWRDDIRRMINNILEERGTNNISYEDIIIEVIPKARAMVPEEVRQELHLRVRQSLLERSDPE